MRLAAPANEHSMRFGGGNLALWAAAAALVFSGHVAIAYAVQGLSTVEQTEGGPPPAQTIEIAAIAMMPAEQAQLATEHTTQPDQSEPMPTREEPVDTSEGVAEQADRVAPDEAESVRPEPVGQGDDRPETAAPEPIASAATSPERANPVDPASPEEIIPDPVETVAPEAAVSLPRSRPAEVAIPSSKPFQPKAKPARDGRKKKPMNVNAKKPVDKPRPRARQERAAAPKPVETAGSDAQPATRTAAPQARSQSPRSGSSSGWESRLHSWIGRHTRYPNAARARRASGQPYVVMTLDASGRVLSARLFRSSGNDDLDGAALSALRGATVPAPPPEKVGTAIVAPFTFVLRK
jgi:protein TonB